MTIISSSKPIQDPVSRVPGVGSRYAEALERLGIRTVTDLLWHFPARWVDRRELQPLGSLTAIHALPRTGPGDGRPRKPVVTSLGVVTKTFSIGAPAWGKGGRFSRKAAARGRLQVTLRDDTGETVLVFFGGSWRKDHFQVGSRVLVSGTVGKFRKDIQFQNPEYEILDHEEAEAIHTGSLYPVYPLTKSITQRMLRTWIRYALNHALPRLEDTLPDSLRSRHELIALSPALWGIHFPESPAVREAARRRIVFEELFLDQLLVYGARLRREMGKAAPPVREGALARRIRAGLPFTLTRDQDKVIEEILADLARPRPAQRLLQGDVGSGKTVVALLVAAAAADSGLQTAFMVPTELLAEQHYRTLTQLAGPFGLETRMLTGGMSARARKEVVQALAQGTASVAVGTHALFQEQVRFDRLGLVVVDEQHRFGVQQRLALTEKGKTPHVVAMSATPIPRSLAMVQFADLELSVIRERPAGRGRVTTRVTPESNREKVYAFVADRLREGRQAYIIYPLVEESDKSEFQAATTMAERLAKHPEFAGFEVALLHGQMRPEEKDAIMRRFVGGEIAVLVATTVVEVGIDVANATFLIIEHPERYGLSQLHQLRGRIGRGEHASYCVLIRGNRLDPDASKRLELFARTEDGFELARQDLAIRGRGDLFGTRQSGRPNFRLADPERDTTIIEAARTEARSILDHDRLVEGSPEWSGLFHRVKRRLEEFGSLADAG